MYQGELPSLGSAPSAIATTATWKLRQSKVTSPDTPARWRLVRRLQVAGFENGKRGARWQGRRLLCTRRVRIGDFVVGHQKFLGRRSAGASSWWWKCGN